MKLMVAYHHPGNMLIVGTIHHIDSLEVLTPVHYHERGVTFPYGKSSVGFESSVGGELSGELDMATEGSSKG